MSPVCTGALRGRHAADPCALYCLCGLATCFTTCPPEKSLRLDRGRLARPGPVPRWLRIGVRRGRRMNRGADFSRPRPTHASEEDTPAPLDSRRAVTRASARSLPPDLPLDGADAVVRGGRGPVTHVTGYRLPRLRRCDRSPLQGSRLFAACEPSLAGWAEYAAAPLGQCAARRAADRGGRAARDPARRVAANRGGRAAPDPAGVLTGVVARPAHHGARCESRRVSTAIIC
jgi:hypothetical protein